MKQIKYDPQQAAKEKKEREKAQKENEERRDYLESLKKNRRFQKYVVEEILNNHIKNLTNIENLFPKGFDIGKQKEEAADLVTQSLIASKTLKKILSDLLN